MVHADREIVENALSSDMGIRLPGDLPMNTG